MPVQAKRIEFWFDLASNYSYLSAMRIAKLAADAGVEVIWKPFLLGPIFKAQGWNTSPFNLYPAKGRNMVRDMQRTTASRNMPPFVLPRTFPAASLAAVRLAHLGERDGWTPRFTREVFTASFADGKDIADIDVLSEILSGIGLDAGAAFAASTSEVMKQSLRQRHDEAVRHGIYGAPSFITADGELFWGDDRLEQALAWAART